MIAENIFKKLKLISSQRNLIVNAPAEYLRFIGDLDFDTALDVEKAGSYDFVQVFATKQVELKSLVKEYAEAGKYDCIFWGCYPKGGGAIKSDIKRETVWHAFTLVNMHAVSQVAIDETWSA
ncbi:MAG: hypothetical protein Q8908_17050, partial [Bacteroidota bacterium]|nr:hypothetical protein [Bacteroidota bacterium]